MAAPRTAALALAMAGAAAAPTACSRQAAPALTFATVDLPGLQQWLGAQKGRPLLVNFWATWCAPCVAELPDLVDGTAEFRAAGGVLGLVALERMVDGVSTADAEQKVRTKAAELGLQGAVLVYTGDEFLPLREALQVELGALPQTAAFDATGRLVALHEGTGTAETFRELALRVR